MGQREENAELMALLEIPPTATREEIERAIIEQGLRTTRIMALSVEEMESSWEAHLQACEICSAIPSGQIIACPQALTLQEQAREALREARKTIRCLSWCMDLSRKRERDLSDFAFELQTILVEEV